MALNNWNGLSLVLSVSSTFHFWPLIPPRLTFALGTPGNVYREMEVKKRTPLVLLVDNSYNSTMTIA